MKQTLRVFASPAEFVTPRAILTGHDCEVTCASVCAELGLVISGCRGKANHTHSYFNTFLCVYLFYMSFNSIKTEVRISILPRNWVCVLTEGPCLVHSMNGDLLRTLEGPDGCVRPRLVLASTEGHCVIYYDKGHFCVFSINGKLLGHMEVEDNIKVNMTHVELLTAQKSSIIPQQINRLSGSFVFTRAI